MRGAGRWTGSPFLSSQMQQRQRRPRGAELIHVALARWLVRAPAQEFRAVAESTAAKMIVLHLDDELGIDRFPLAGPFGAPAAGTARRFPGEPAAFFDGFLQL